MISLKESETPQARRRIAGQDPLKREQILDGAKHCFLQTGFEAASMNEITAQAGVSKGTIYVYFDSKEELFAALIDRERARILASVEGELDGDHPTREALARFGIAIVQKLTSDEVIRSQRMVLGIIERMPRVATRFFSQDQLSARSVLRRFLEAKVAAGELVVADFDLAASQFLELSMAWLFKSRLFGNRTEPYGKAEISRVVEAGVDVFLHYYGAGSGPAAKTAGSKGAVEG